MKYKRIIYSVGLFLFFSIFWLWMNRNYIAEFNELGERGLRIIMTSEAGFNCILEHGVIYAAIYIIILNMEIPRMDIQFFVRKKRIYYLLWMYKRISMTALIFASVYIVVLGILTMIFEKMKLLLNVVFFKLLLILYLLLVLYYIFIGSLYGLVYVVRNVSGVAIVGSVIASALIFLIGYYNEIWTPVMSLSIIDQFLQNSLSDLLILFDIIKMIVIIAGIMLIDKIIIESKDIIDEKN